MSLQIEETFYHIDVHEQEIVGNIKEFVLYGLGRQEAAINSPEVECGLQQKKKKINRHGLEGDFNRRGTSVFSGQVGELVASELCTVVDDGTMVDRRGSVAIDDEGTPGQYNVLIENGILKGYMQDKLNARLMGMTPTGNGRRESYAHLPMPRMTNTYMLPGKSTPQEIIESVEYGIYAPNFGGGQVDITSGKFVFSTSEAYLIENGKVTKPVKGATLIGSGIETMQQISMVGNDLKLDNGVGVCGKEGQSLPVGVGQPTLKVNNLTVGGTA